MCLFQDSDEIEDELFSAGPDAARRIYKFSREIIGFTRATPPLRAMLEALERGVGKDHLDLELRRNRARRWRQPLPSGRWSGASGRVAEPVAQPWSVVLAVLVRRLAHRHRNPGSFRHRIGQKPWKKSIGVANYQLQVDSGNSKGLPMILPAAQDILVAAERAGKKAGVLGLSSGPHGGEGRRHASHESCATSIGNEHHAGLQPYEGGVESWGSDRGSCYGMATSAPGGRAEHQGGSGVGHRESRRLSAGTQRCRIRYGPPDHTKEIRHWSTDFLK